MMMPMPGQMPGPMPPGMPPQHIRMPPGPPPGMPPQMAGMPGMPGAPPSSQVSVDIYLEDLMWGNNVWYNLGEIKPSVTTAEMYIQ